MIRDLIKLLLCPSNSDEGADILRKHAPLPERYTKEETEIPYNISLENKKLLVNTCARIFMLLSPFSITDGYDNKNKISCTPFYYMFQVWKDRLKEKNYDWLDDISDETIRMIIHVTCTAIEEVCFLTRFRRVGYLLGEIYFQKKINKICKT